MKFDDCHGKVKNDVPNCHFKVSAENAGADTESFHTLDNIVFSKL